MVCTQAHNGWKLGTGLVVLWYSGTTATKKYPRKIFTWFLWLIMSDGSQDPIVRILSDGKIWVLWFIMPPKQHPSLESTRHTFWNHHSSSFQKPQNKSRAWKLCVKECWSLPYREGTVKNNLLTSCILVVKLNNSNILIINLKSTLQRSSNIGVQYEAMTLNGIRFWMVDYT